MADDYVPELMIGLGERTLGRRDEVDGEQTDLLATPERLVRDVVPAEVRFPDGERLLRARVFITDRRVQVWIEGRPAVLAHDLELVEAPAVASIHASVGTPHRLVTPLGEVQVRRARGTCSCRLPGLMALSWSP